MNPSGEACNGQDDDCNGTVDDNLVTADNLSTFTCGRGACQNSVSACTAGVLGACIAHSTSTDVDDCNGIDDDCDGQVDEDGATAISGCIHVAPDGQDGVAGTMAAPLASIDMAITAAMTAPSRTVCVAGGRTCADETAYSLGEGGVPFQMANGISVYGNYESRTWTRCPINASAPTSSTTLEMRDAGGVRFPPSVVTPTTLDGFIITRANAATTTAITVNGAKQVRLSNLVVADMPTAMHSYGVNLLNGGQALITHSFIQGGAGSLQSIGVRAWHSKPTVRENCSELDPSPGAAPPLLVDPGARHSWSARRGDDGISTAVAPGGVARRPVETSTLCGDQGKQAIGVRIVSDATNVAIRGNLISASAGTTASMGIWAEDCNGAAPGSSAMS